MMLAWKEQAHASLGQSLQDPTAPLVGKGYGSQLDSPP